MNMAFKKTILFDASVLAQGNKTGVYRVAHELLRFLLDSDSYNVKLTLTHEQLLNGQENDLRTRLIKYCEVHGITTRFVESDNDPAFCNIDIFFSPFFPVPIHWAEEKRVTKVVVAYDLIALHQPEYFDGVVIDIVREFYDRIQDDWLVLAISQSTKNDLLSYKPKLKSENITVMHLGADKAYTIDISSIQKSQVRKKYGIPLSKPMVLSVATLEVRKNLVTIIKGYANYVTENKNNDSCLVLVGMKGWKLEQLESEIAQYQCLKNRVILTGFVDEDDLPTIYADATAFVYMSFYEGFGLPPLEAMSCGVPVITSNTSSLPEVVHDAGIQLDPLDVKGLSRAIQNILTNEQTRQDFSMKSLERSKYFSWQQCKQIFLSTLDTVSPSKDPFLSIVTICLNEESVKATADSICSQSYRKFEWIVIDGGSKAPTKDILLQFRNRMSYFVSEPDNGRYDAMNKGITRSNGKYLLFLNAGDYLHDPNTLQTIFAYSVPVEKSRLFHLKLFAPIVYGEVLAQETGMFPYPNWKTGPQNHNIDFFRGASLPHQATFIKKELFTTYGFYKSSLKYAGDYEWFLRVLVASQIESQYVPSIVSVYNFDGISSKSIAADAPHIKEIQKVYKEFSQGPKKVIQVSDESIKIVPKNSKRQVHNLYSIDFVKRLLNLVQNKITDEEIRFISLLIQNQTNSHTLQKPVEIHEKIKHFYSVARQLVLLIIRVDRKMQTTNDDLALVPFVRVISLIRETLFIWAQKRKLLLIPLGSTNSRPSTSDNDDLISYLYTHYLGRNPAKDEVGQWIHRFNNGISLQDIEKMIATSKEAQLLKNEQDLLQVHRKALSLENWYPIGKNRYSMTQNALRSLARTSKYLD